MKQPMSKKEFRRLEQSQANAELLVLTGLICAQLGFAVYIQRSHLMREEVKRWRTATATGRGANAVSAPSPPATPSVAGDGAADL